MTPAVDLAFLAQRDTLVTGGVEERASFVELAGTRCLAILDRPRDRAARGPGFVVCHAFGDEFVNLRRIERGVARTLAREGHPVLTFHRRGYGDSQGTPAAGVAEHVAEVRAAASHLAAETGVHGVGLIGARFGALVAGVVAREGGIDRLLLMNPALRGLPFFRDLARQAMIVRLAEEEGASQSPGDLLAGLETGDMVEAHGYPVHRTLFEGFAPVDLTADIGSFRGDALVLQAARSSRIPPDVEAFRALVESHGGRCTVEVLPEPPGTRFGQKPFQPVARSTIRRNLQGPIQEAMSERAAAWVSR